MIDIKIIILIILVFIIFLISIDNNSPHKYETFKDNIDNIDNIDNKKNLLVDSFVYTNIEGIYTILKNDKIYIVDDKKIIFNKSFKKFINNPLNLQDNTNIKTGYFNYKDNNVILLINNNIYKYLINENTISKPIYYKQYFKDIDKHIDNIDSMFYLNDNIYLFRKEKVLIYDIINDKIIKTLESNKIFDKCPSNINKTFINFNDIYPQKSLCYIYLIQNKTLYRYYYSNKKFVFDNKYKNIYNIDDFPYKIEKFVVNFSSNEARFTATTDGYYRIIPIGGGAKMGGYGGMIYNDYYLKKNEKLDFITGEQGSRIPLRDKSSMVNTNITINSILEKLPYNSSCSGSGGTFVFKNNKLIMVAGGGGGWTSEFIKAPYICNSLKYPNKNGIIDSDLFFPIKKMVIETEHNNDNVSFKLIVKTLDIEIKNYDEINFNVKEHPQFDILDLKKKKFKYETAYINTNDIAQIEIVFDNVITDYTINLDYDIIFKKNSKFVNSNIVFYDEQNRKYTINNFKNNYKYKYITSKNILNFLTKNRYPAIVNENDNVKNGNKLISRYDEISKIIPFKKKLENKLFLKGGIGGGGSSYSNKYKEEYFCGGGGGYIGGKACILKQKQNNKNQNYPSEYMAGTGGSSYIKKLNLKDINLLDSLFINNYNDDNGRIIIFKKLLEKV